MNDLKSTRELINLDAFRMHFPAFPKGRLIKSESPDFILKTSQKYSIGIELTSLPSPSYTITGETVSSFLEDLQHSILKKEAKLKIYRGKKANEYWLIIFADVIDIKNVNYMELISGTNCNDFRKIFLFDLFNGIIHELSARADK